MDFKPKTRTWQVYLLLRIVSWITYLGFCIQFAAIVITYGVSLFNPGLTKSLYHGDAFYNLSHFNIGYYTGAVLLMSLMTLVKCYVWRLVIKALGAMKLESPFTYGVAALIERISYALFGAWFVSLLSLAYSGLLLKIDPALLPTDDPGPFLFMAGLLFIIGKVFRRGVELQSESDLTV